MLDDSCSAKIRLFNPCKTLPGPTSKNDVNPSRLILEIISDHRTGDSSCFRIFDLSSSVLVTGSALTF